MHLFEGLFGWSGSKATNDLLEDALDDDVETTIHNEEVELGISSPNEDDDEDDDE